MSWGKGHYEERDSARAADRRQQITHAFARAVDTYDAHAELQQRVALRLLGWLESTTSWPHEAQRVLEVGCGTGLLSVALREHFATAQLVLTDLVPKMLTRCHTKLAATPPSATAPATSHTSFVVMDGELPALAPATCDAIFSSLALQWLQDLPRGLARLTSLLRPGGTLAFATLGADTFREWREAHDETGVACGTPSYPTMHELRALLPAWHTAQLDEERLLRRYPNTSTFTHELKAIGANVPVPGHRPLSAAKMRLVRRHLDTQPEVTMTYHVIYGRLTRGG